MLVAGNTRNYAGLAEITREAQADDGLLDVCVYEGQGHARTSSCTCCGRCSAGTAVEEGDSTAR